MKILIIILGSLIMLSMIGAMRPRSRSRSPVRSPPRGTTRRPVVTPAPTPGPPPPTSPPSRQHGRGEGSQGRGGQASRGQRGRGSVQPNDSRDRVYNRIPGFTRDNPIDPDVERPAPGSLARSRAQARQERQRATEGIPRYARNQPQGNVGRGQHQGRNTQTQTRSQRVTSSAQRQSLERAPQTYQYPGPHPVPSQFDTPDTQHLMQQWRWGQGHPRMVAALNDPANQVSPGAAGAASTDEFATWITNSAISGAQAAAAPGSPSSASDSEVEWF